MGKIPHTPGRLGKIPHTPGRVGKIPHTPDQEDIMLKNIVVPLDSSDYSWSAAQHAIQMARPYRAAIHGIYAIDAKIVKGQILDDLNIDPATARNLYQSKGRMLLEQFEEKCKGAGVEFHPILTDGIVPDVIGNAASQVKSELIVMGKRGINAPWSGPLLGSIAETAIRQARRPVLLAQESYVPIETAYVAYDGELVSIRALRFVADLCALYRWKMSVISVHDSEEHRKKLLQQAVEMAELHGLKITTIGRSGDATEQILDVTSEDTVALIALGAYSSRLRRLILGDIPEQVMRKSAQPVLVYRPLPS
jgi:nucleotide-binding universal stress UspA family protein